MSDQQQHDKLKEQVKQDNLQSMAIVRQLLPWRQKLATNFGTTHGNAQLELIDVLLVMLAGFFNPMVRSQRLLDALSSQKWIQQQTGVGRVPRSTLSDALKRFDPESLRPLIEDLVKRVPALKRRDADLEQITRQVLAVDGSSFNLAGEVAWALQCRRGRTDQVQSRVRLNLHLDVQTFAPTEVDISGDGDGSEPKALRRRIKPGVVYVMDRNFLEFALINAIVEADSDLVLRLRKSTVFAVDHATDLTDADREHGVQADEHGRLTGGKTSNRRHCSAAPPAQTLRRVKVWDEVNQCELVLLTNLMDVPAYVIGALYRRRWQIELFFKWLKSYAQVKHLMSRSAQGVSLEFYVSVIATLLLHLATGRRVSKYALFWMNCVASGQATFEEMEEGLRRVEREKALERARLKRKREREKVAN